MRARIRILSGDRFRRLVAVKLAPRGARGEERWSFRCDCGTTKTIVARSVRSGLTNSCGCFGTERRRDPNLKHRTHGHAKSRVYSIWAGMIQRCTDPNQPAKFRRYGARGIRVCERWRTFENFLADMGEPPSRRHSIDRINNEGHYEPGNCRWADQSQQNNNTRANRLLTFAGKTQTQSEWAKETGMSQFALHQRLAHGWSVERALTTPIQRRNNFMKFMEGKKKVRERLAGEEG